MVSPGPSSGSSSVLGSNPQAVARSFSLPQGPNHWAEAVVVQNRPAAMNRLVIRIVVFIAVVYPVKVNQSER